MEVAPGLYRDVPFATYLSWNAVNHSILKLFRESAAQVHHELTHPNDSTEAQEIGTALHLACLESDRLEKEYFPAPECDKRNKEGKAIWAAAEVEAAGRIMLRDHEYKEIMGMRDAIFRHPVALQLFQKAKATEVSIAWIDPDTGVLCKARIDVATSWDGFPTIGDLKSIERANEFACSQAVHKYSYHSQAAFYLDGMDSLFPAVRRHMLIFAEKAGKKRKRFQDCRVYELAESALIQGREDNRRHLEQYAEATKSGKWPGYPTQILPLDLPRYAQRGQTWSDDED